MDLGASYVFETPEQFWSELDDVLSVSPVSSLDELDYSLRNYVAITSAYMEEYLSSPELLDQALFKLLSSPLFTSHVERMTVHLISFIVTPASRASLFIVLVLILHLGMSNPLSPSASLLHLNPTAKLGVGGGAKVFRLMRKRWNDVVPVLKTCVDDAAILHGSTTKYDPNRVIMKPQDGWEERLGTAATAILYELCRVQRLNATELSSFDYNFICHLFNLVELTRNAEDETFNYSLIKLLIALNEQFMVMSLPSNHGNGLPPPILPTIIGERKRPRDSNLVLEALRSKESDSKTFGENLIFILNRSNGSPDSLCVSLLILKLLYLLFTTTGTHEYFYTNDLCVLVDVFIRELCDLGEESEGLKHTFLRVLHPLLNNTQLRHFPYKRDLLRKALKSLIQRSHYRDIDPTTRRLVERNLRGSWCEGLNDDDDGRAKRKPTTELSPSSSNSASTVAVDSNHHHVIPHPQIPLDMLEVTRSTGSFDQVATADDKGKKSSSSSRRRLHKLQVSSSLLGSDDSNTVVLSSSPLFASASSSSSLSSSSTSKTTERVGPHEPETFLLAAPRPSYGRQRSSSLWQEGATAESHGHGGTHRGIATAPPPRPASTEPPRRRRAPPPPETPSRPRTPLPAQSQPQSIVEGRSRRAAPDPPRPSEVVDKLERLALSP